MSNFPSVRPSLNLQFDSQPTPEDMTSHLASVGATFSRASIGTYTDANGLIQEASAGQARPNYSSAGVHEGLLIEESRTNLVETSEDFSLPYVADPDLEPFKITVERNNIIAPDGKASADRMVETSDTGTHAFQIDSLSNQQYTLSVFAKAGERDHIALALLLNGTNVQGIFDLSNGTVTAFSGFTIPDSLGIEDYGNGWYRCYIVSNDNNTRASIGITKDDGTTSYAGDTTKGLYLWGAQLEAGSFPTSYIPTIPTFSSRASDGTYFDSDGVLQTASTNVARTDHKYIDGQWVEAGLLLEGASTNEYIYSEDFSSATSLTRGVITTNTIEAPDGETTADTLTDNNSGGSGAVFLQRTITVSTSTDYTFSIFAKKNTLDYLAIGALDFTSVDAYSWFNLNNGTLGTAGSGISTSIEDVSNGWYRCSISFTSDSSDTSGSIRLLLADTNTDTSVDLDGTSSVYLWGAQLEEQSQPTSYIPTSGGTATRSADVYTTATKVRSADICYIDGTAFTDFYNQEQGTVFVNVKGVGISGTQGVYDLGASGTNSVDLRFQSDGTYRTYVNSSGTAVFVSTSATKNLNSTKLITAYKQDDFVFSADDTNFSTDTSGNIPNAGTKLNIGTIDDNSNFRACIALAKFIYFPRRLSNTEIQKLTR